MHSSLADQQTAKGHVLALAASAKRHVSVGQRNDRLIESGLYVGHYLVSSTGDAG